MTMITMCAIFTLVLSCDPVFGHVCVHDGSCLQEKLPQERFGDLLVQATHIHSGI